MTRWSRFRTRFRPHWAKRRRAVGQAGPNTGDSCRQVQPEVVAKVSATKYARSRPDVTHGLLGAAPLILVLLAALGAGSS